MARFLGDQLEQDEAKIATVEHALTAATAFAMLAPAGETIATAIAAAWSRLAPAEAAAIMAFAMVRVFMSKH
jgi:Flp pilus assembly pilin Flp